MPCVPVKDIGCRAGVAGVEQVSRGVAQSGSKQYKRGKRWCNTTRG